MKTAIANLNEAAKRESQLFQTNPIHVVKATPPSNHKKGGELRDTHRPKRQFSSKSTEDKKPSYTCFSCGETGHSRKHCKHRDKVCCLCNLKGHIAKVCRKTRVHSVKPDSLQDHSDLEGDMYTIFELNNVSKLDIKVPLKIEGLPAEMQLDAGCAFTLAPKYFYEKFCSHLPLKSTEVILTTYTRDKIKPLGEVKVDVEYASRNYSLPLLIVNAGTTALFGRNWLCKINLDWHSLQV